MRTAMRHTGLVFVLAIACRCTPSTPKETAAQIPLQPRGRPASTSIDSTPQYRVLKNDGKFGQVIAHRYTSILAADANDRQAVERSIREIYAKQKSHIEQASPEAKWKMAIIWVFDRDPEGKKPRPVPVCMGETKAAEIMPDAPTITWNEGANSLIDMT